MTNIAFKNWYDGLIVEDIKGKDNLLRTLWKLEDYHKYMKKEYLAFTKEKRNKYKGYYAESEIEWKRRYDIINKTLDFYRIRYEREGY